jgi:hypothetical protein
MLEEEELRVVCSGGATDTVAPRFGDFLNIVAIPTKLSVGSFAGERAVLKYFYVIHASNTPF